MGARKKGHFKRPFFLKNLALKNLCSLSLAFMPRLSIKLEQCTRSSNEEIPLQESVVIFGYNFARKGAKHLANI